MPGLTVGRELRQHSGALLGLAECRTAEAEAGGGETLQPAQPDVVQPAPPPVDPGRLEPGQEGPARDVISDAGRTPCLRPPFLSDAGLRPMGAFQGRFDVHEGLRWQQQLDLGPPPEVVPSHSVPQLG